MTVRLDSDDLRDSIRYAAIAIPQRPVPGPVGSVHVSCCDVILI